MAEGIKDRRVRKTRLALRCALLRLMSVKGVQAITVKELCAECDINRGTFYLHYSDVRSLLNEIEDETLAKMEVMLRDFSLIGISVANQPSPILKVMFTFLAESADLCRVMLSANGDSAFVEKIKDIVREKFREEWRAKYPCNDDLPIDFVFSFIVAGTMGVLQDWLCNKMPMTADQVALMVEMIIVKGASGLMN